MKTFVKRWLLPPSVADFLYQLVGRLLPNNEKTRTNKDSSDKSESLETFMSAGWADFREAVSRAHVYAENGAGESTVFVASHTGASVRSVESDPEWVNRVLERVSRPVDLVYVDVGPTGPWGKPVSYSHAESFSSYLRAPFEAEYSPDFVLIDGRFRVACFLTTLLHTKPGTTIVVDDYVTRPHYHLVESLVAPDHIGVRQAFFTRPSSISKKQVNNLLQKFEYVMD